MPRAISQLPRIVSLAVQSIVLLVFSRRNEARLRLGVADRYSESFEVEAHRRRAIAGPTPAQLRLLDDHLKPEADVLDIGCGAGGLCFAVRARGHRVIGIDLAEPMVRQAIALTRELDVPVPFGVVDAQSLAFRDESFDVALMLGSVLSHVPGRAARLASLRDVYRVLRPGGSLLLETQSRVSRRTYRVFFALLAWMRLALVAMGRPPGWEVGDRVGVEVSEGGPGTRLYFHMYAPDELDADLREAGFEPRPIDTALYLMRFVATKR